MLRSRRPKVFAAAVTLILFDSQPVTAQQATIDIRGEVPTICNVQVRGLVHRGGQMREFCNAGRGYDVYVDPSPALSGASLSVDGSEVALSASQPTLISSSDTPQNRVRRLALRAGRETPSLAIRVVPRT